MPEKSNGLQDLFLNSLRRSKMPVTMFLVKGVKLQGIITWFDQFSVLLRRDGQTQLVYKHAISTIMPSGPVNVGEAGESIAVEGRKPKQLQDVFLSAVKRSEEPVTMFLVNGVMLQGEVIAYDLFSLLLFREGMVQLVYKHAVSTIQPSHALNLQEEDEDDDSADTGAESEGDSD